MHDERCERRASETSNKHICSNQMGCFSHGPAQSKPSGWRNFFAVNCVDKHSNLDQSPVRPTHLSKMNEKGREFTSEIQEKEALDCKKEFRRILHVVEKLIT